MLPRGKSEAVPEVAINEHHYGFATKHNVGRTGKIVRVLAETKAVPLKRRAKGSF
jgi:hypothetical protein